MHYDQNGWPVVGRHVGIVIDDWALKYDIAHMQKKAMNQFYEQIYKRSLPNAIGSNLAEKTK